MSTFTYTPSMTPDLADALAYETSLPAVDTSGGFEDPAVAEWHRARLAQSTTTPTLSSTGRRSFKVVHTSERFDVDVIVDHDGTLAPTRTSVRVKSRDLIGLANDWMAEHADQCDGCEACGWHDDACTEDGCVRGCEHAPIALMGRDGDGRHFAQVIRGDRSDNTGDAPGEFAGWPTRYGVKRRSYRDHEVLAPVEVPNPRAGMAHVRTDRRTGDVTTHIEASTLTVHALPSSTDDERRIHIGGATYPRTLTVRETRAARQATARETSVNAPLCDAGPIEALWAQLSPGEAVEATIGGHTLRLSQGMSGQVRASYGGSSWKARTPRAVAQRIA